jgi:hypothetical protein
MPHHDYFTLSEQYWSVGMLRCSIREYFLRILAWQRVTMIQKRHAPVAHGPSRERISSADMLNELRDGRVIGCGTPCPKRRRLVLWGSVAMICTQEI